MEGLEGLYGRHREAVCRMRGRLSGWCGQAVRRVWQGCQESVGILLEGVGGCMMVWRGCVEGVGRLSGWGGEVIWRVWDSCLEGVGKLSGGCREAA